MYIHRLLFSLLSGYGAELSTKFLKAGQMEFVLSQVWADLNAYVQNDPATGGSYWQVLKAYRSFYAVAAYRLSHRLICFFTDQLPAQAEMAHVSARMISEHAKAYSGVEIHPQAAIGRGLVMDHGWGTVIGQTTTIGRNCYILQGVILGGRAISGNPNGKRHPTLGDNVQLGGGAKLFGNITIGDDVFIGPGCVITTDIPAGTKIYIRTEYQVVSTVNHSNAVFNL